MIERIKYDDWIKNHVDHSKIRSMLVDSYSSGVWAIKSEGRWSPQYQGGCYGSLGYTLRSYSMPHLQALRIVLWKHTHADWWFDNILDPETSPWHSVVKQIGTPRIYLAGASSVLMYGVLEFQVHQDMSLRNTMSMMIALRQTRVEPSSVKKVYTSYTRQKKAYKDLSFGEALAISCCTTPIDGKRSNKPQMFISGNGWLGTSKFFSPRHLAQGVFADTSLPFSSFSYYPSDATWNCQVNHQDYDTFLRGGTEVKEEPFFKYNFMCTPLHRPMFKYDIEFDKMLEFVRSPIRKEKATSGTKKAA